MAYEDVLFKSGMRQLASGVSLVASVDRGGRRYGLIATSVTSVCVSPPMLLVCVNKSASCYDAIKNSGAFCINFLGQSDSDIASQFGSPKYRDLRFGTGNWMAGKTGAPVLASALASFDCSVRQEMDMVSHSVFIGDVLEIHVKSEIEMPLIYHNGSYASINA
tara:strand:- start:500 stop:988 length:489 start_codon:yes stop_codon:yes gene_type:complete